MSAKKVMTLILCMVLVAALSVAGTLAYLTSTDAVANTMTMGDVEITMDETDVDVYGVQDGPTRVEENTYRLVPGRVYTKDPIIHVSDNSDSCWLFVKLENGISEIEADANKISDQIGANGWALLKNEGTAAIYYKAWDMDKDEHNVPVFQNFTIDADADNGDIEEHNDAKVNVTAYAVQMAGFENIPGDAWNAYFAQNPTPNP